MIARHEIDIETPLDTVWKLHLDVHTWPTWQTPYCGAERSAESPAWHEWLFSETPAGNALT